MKIVPKTPVDGMQPNPMVHGEGFLHSPLWLSSHLALIPVTPVTSPTTTWEENGFHLPGRSMCDPEQINLAAATLSDGGLTIHLFY